MKRLKGARNGYKEELGNFKDYFDAVQVSKYFEKMKIQLETPPVILIFSLLEMNEGFYTYYNEVITENITRRSTRWVAQMTLIGILASIPLTLKSSQFVPSITKRK
jgi:hypothetical protein